MRATHRKGLTIRLKVQAFAEWRRLKSFCSTEISLGFKAIVVKPRFKHVDISSQHPLHFMQ